MDQNRHPNIPEETEDDNEDENEDENDYERQPLPLPPADTIPTFRRASIPLLHPSRSAKNNYKMLGESKSEFYLGIDRRPSITLPSLKVNEKEFFDIIFSRDSENARKYLEENPLLNINCVNFQGVSPLHAAIESRCDSIVALLLEQNQIEVGDCALRAIRDNLPLSTIEMLLAHMNVESSGCTNSTEFPEYITPLILAAQCGHYEIIKMLIDRGHTIETPHPLGCNCENCLLQAETDDLLNAAAARLSTFRAIANPAYMCQTSNDPILKAFILSNDLMNRSNAESEFRGAYLALATDVSQFAVELMGCCRTTEEVEMVLKQVLGSVGMDTHFPRLSLAMVLKQKQFVAHPNTQQVMNALWIGEWHTWSRSSLIFRLFTPIVRVVTIPFILFLCLFMPNHRITRIYTSPVSKFISHLSSYIVFLILLFLESNMDKKTQIRGPPNSGLEPIIILYVIGHIWSCLRMMVLKGPKNYFRNISSWNDLSANFLFVVTFLFWIASIVDIEKNDQRHLERKYWYYLDPTLIAEGTFTLAVILSYLRLMTVCQFSYQLGPLQISLGKMGADIAKYTVIFFILIIAFSAGLTRFYQYYEGMIQTDYKSGVKTSQVQSFTDFESTLKTLFWGLFCMSPLESADVVIENLPGDTEELGVLNEHKFTETIGYIAFACFQVIAVIVILNMLIATMSNTFQRVTDNVDVEWTFARTSIYLDYVIQTALPSPLNLIPTPAGILSFLNWIRGLATRGKCCAGLEIPFDENLEREYQVLISQLVQRYFREKDVNEAPNGPAELDMIKAEVNDLKNMMRNFMGEQTE